jgi:hypothetical protein
VSFGSQKTNTNSKLAYWKFGCWFRNFLLPKLWKWKSIRSSGSAETGEILEVSGKRKLLCRVKLLWALIGLLQFLESLLLSQLNISIVFNFPILLFLFRTLINKDWLVFCSSFPIFSRHSRGTEEVPSDFICKFYSRVIQTVLGIKSTLTYLLSSVSSDSSLLLLLKHKIELIATIVIRKINFSGRFFLNISSASF